MRKTASALETLSAWLLASLVLLILAADLFSRADYPARHPLLLPNGVCLLLGLALLGAVFALLRVRRVGALPDIRVLSALLFLVQVYVCRSIYFRTGWDVGIVTRAAASLAAGEVTDHMQAYFSVYPNNTLIALILSVFCRAEALAGFWQDPFFAAVVFQCLLSALAGKLLYDICESFCGRREVAALFWLAYAALVSLSPWLVIPYTDSMGLILPLAALRLYQKTADGRRLPLKWAGVALVAYWGGKLKPQVMIVCIAVVLAELLRLLQTRDRQWPRRAGASMLAAALCIAGSMALYARWRDAAGIHPDEEAFVGPLHMLMMGLNPETHGVFSEDDLAFSTGFETRAERTAGQLGVIRRRLADFGLPGLLRHVHIKTLINFNDGSFAWGNEGNFYPEDTMPEPVNDFACPFLRNLYYSTNPGFIRLNTLEQALWLAALALCIPALRRKREPAGTALVLSLIGIILFVTLFEARARYLLLYAPLFLAQAACGFCELLSLPGRARR